MNGGDDPRPFYTVSNREIYTGLRDVEHRLQALENRIDSVLGENVHLRNRVRSLELKSYGIMAGLLGAIVVLFKVGGWPT